MCPLSARATEVKFSAGGDKLGVRYDSEPDLEIIKRQVQSVANVKLRVSDKNPQVVNKRDHRVEIQLQSKGDQLMDVMREQLGADVVPDHAGEAVGERLSREDLLRLVAQKLSVQEHRLVYLKYWEELPMREIGEVLGLSESRVCKIHAHLLERLRDRLRVASDD